MPPRTVVRNTKIGTRVKESDAAFAFPSKLQALYNATCVQTYESLIPAEWPECGYVKFTMAEIQQRKDRSEAYVRKLMAPSETEAAADTSSEEASEAAAAGKRELIDKFLARIACYSDILNNRTNFLENVAKNDVVMRFSTIADTSITIYKPLDDFAEENPIFQAANPATQGTGSAYYLVGGDNCSTYCSIAIMTPISGKQLNLTQYLDARTGVILSINCCSMSEVSFHKLPTWRPPEGKSSANRRASAFIVRYDFYSKTLSDLYDRVKDEQATKLARVARY